MPATNLIDKNSFCELLGIRYPICQAGMYQVAYGKLVAAVSKAGGLGVIGSAFMEPEDLRREIRIVKEYTDKPFGVDILFAELINNHGDPLAGHLTQNVGQQRGFAAAEKTGHDRGRNFIELHE